MVSTDLVGQRRQARVFTEYGRQSCFWTKCKVPGPKTVIATAIGQVFGPGKRNYTEDECGGLAPEKRITLLPLLATDTTLSSVGLETMGGVPVHQKRFFSQNLDEVDSEN